jgi:hypothetical protein
VQVSGDDKQNEETVSDETQQPEGDDTPEVKAEDKPEPKRRGRKPKAPEPSLGRMVRYVTVSNTVRPAVITRVHEDDVVDVTVFNSLGAQPVERVAPGSEDESGTYHWPEFN